jgi:hypothetical protein
VILRYITQFLIVLSPLVSGDWSLLDLFGYRPDAAGNVSVAHMAILTGMKAEVEFKLKVGIAVTLFALTLVSEFTSVAMPLEQMRRFRERLLDDQYKKEWKDLLGDGFRLNVMYLRRSMKSLWLFKYFEWSWSKNFEPPNHRDSNLLLFSWQGLAGLAVKLQDPKADYFDSSHAPRALRAPYYLWPWQIAKTAQVKGILSVPILKRSSDAAPRFHCVGVINIDAITDEAAGKLKRNVKKRAQYFLVVGGGLGDLSL